MHCFFHESAHPLYHLNYLGCISWNTLVFYGASWFSNNSFPEFSVRLLELCMMLKITSCALQRIFLSSFLSCPLALIVPLLWSISLMKNIWLPSKACLNSCHPLITFMGYKLYTNTHAHTHVFRIKNYSIYICIYLNSFEVAFVITVINNTLLRQKKESFVILSL